MSDVSKKPWVGVWAGDVGAAFVCASAAPACVLARCAQRRNSEYRKSTNPSRCDVYMAYTSDELPPIALGQYTAPHRAHLV